MTGTPRPRPSAVLDVVKDQETSVTAACRKVSAELGINADTLRGWAKQAEIDEPFLLAGVPDTCPV
jgi:hypothetical protein